MKSFLLSVMLLFSLSMLCFATDYTDLKTLLENKISISNLEIKTLKLKVKTYQDVTYVSQLESEKQHLKNLKNELDVVKDAIAEQSKNEKLKKEYNESSDRLTNLTTQVERIKQYENY